MFGLTSLSNSADYDFDIGAYDKSPWELFGYLSYSGEQQTLNTDGALYRLNFNNSGLETNTRELLEGELRGHYKWTNSSVYLTAHTISQADSRKSSSELNILEGYYAYQANSRMRYELGKRTLKWGKGYAWNPVGFIERAKDPLDPELSREGYIMANTDYVKSSSGDLRTWGFNVVLLPVDSEINPDFGTEDTWLASKLYLLYLDNNIDLVFMTGAQHQSRFGMDFSRNLSSNFEVHAEWSRTLGDTRPVLQDDLSLLEESLDTEAWLLGLRYLTETNLTAIFELYHNSGGYSVDEMQGFYNEVDAASLPSELDSLRVASLAGYGSAFAMQNYLYLRLIQKEPFDLIHWTPALAYIQNLDDGSGNLGMELLYTGIDDLELRMRLNLPGGASLSEFGEKPSDQRLELRLRYFF